MATKEELNRGIEELQAWLEDKRQAYKQAMEAIEEDGAFLDFLENKLPGAVAMVMAYDPTEHSSDFAVAACAVTQSNLTVLLQTVEFVSNYEERKEQLGNLLSINPSRDQAPGEQ